VFGEDPHAECADELKNDGCRHVLHTIQHAQHDPAERRTDDYAAGNREYKGRRNRRDRETVRRDGSHRKAVDQKCTCVIQKALAFENRQDAMRRSQRSEHCSCGDGIGWSDDGAKCDRRCPWHGWYERVGDDRYRSRRESDREYDQARHRHPVVLEISERGVVRRVEQYGCDEERQRKLGRERERRRHRKKREQRTAERQENGIRRPDAARRTRQEHGRHEETEKLLEFAHITPHRRFNGRDDSQIVRDELSVLAQN
jgi:hypothetical protein